MDFIGSYKLTKNENFDVFLKAVGVPYLIRKLIASSTPVMDISMDGETMTIKTRAFKDNEISFKIDEEFEEKLFNGETVKALVTCEGNRMEQKHLSGSNPCEYIREINGEELKVTCKCKDAVGVRYFTRVSS